MPSIFDVFAVVTSSAVAEEWRMSEAESGRPESSQ
ncbi:hypothetical protein ALQ59_103067 [Pseudomonas syringae pv. apii]|uniref:Uncharacterized protein n=1 Tax=Pseudomonas syringae pv. apii TaxID=81036 RepID=A0A3M3MXE7_9PSED|nr:hypothetical protein ALQ58_102674 [Pseudomonas syringae pv. apii]RMN51473.1 hypothetical protein ALQ59_103067 [Pseudomonas syringae pv. apii]RMN92146.1 hypothetical protein ALQ49_102252 [Pseudomonas syringae pv. apii]RMR20568.1 hypothetical protein ALP89_102787 [Pseudomonas syringae pv. persicae]